MGCLVCWCITVLCTPSEFVECHVFWHRIQLLSNYVLHLCLCWWPSWSFGRGYVRMHTVHKLGCKMPRNETTPVIGLFQKKLFCDQWKWSSQISMWKKLGLSMYFYLHIYLSFTNMCNKWVIVEHIYSFMWYMTIMFYNKHLYLLL